MQYEKQNPEGLKLKEYPRLADFAEVCEIVSRCMGNTAGQFIQAYFANIELQTREVIESDLVGKAIEIFINRYQKKNKATEWHGTISNLFEPLTKIANHSLKINIKNGKLWPQAPNSLSRKINEIKANLREIGITVEKVSADNNAKQWIIKKNQNLKENEDISTKSPEPTDTPKPSQITNDNNNSLDDGQNVQNHSQLNTKLDTVDSVDIYNTSSKDSYSKKEIAISEGQQEPSKSTGQLSNTNISSIANYTKVSQVLGNYVAFDFEWDTDTHVMEASIFCR